MAGSRGGTESGSVTHRVLTQLLTELDGIEPLNNVSMVAATNRPDILVHELSSLISLALQDKALLRSGRIDRILYIPPPDFYARKEIFDILLKKIPHTEDVNSEELSRMTESYSGAEVA